MGLTLHRLVPSSSFLGCSLGGEAFVDGSGSRGSPIHMEAKSWVRWLRRRLLSLSASLEGNRSSLVMKPKQQQLEFLHHSAPHKAALMTQSF